MYNMPFIDISKIQKKDRPIVQDIIDINGLLVTCPKYNSSYISKIVHNLLIKKLYYYRYWFTPVHYAWGMPHIDHLPSIKTRYIASKIVDQIIRIIMED